MTVRAIPQLETRQPTGLPSWPIGLIAGVEKSGKSWKLAEASASAMINRTLWIGVGEDDPDEYGILPGARFEIVKHDGTYRGILNAVLAAAAAEPGPKGEPNLIVLDSISRLWVLLCDSIQETANERWRKKNKGKDIPDDGIRPSMDLWNVAKDRWGHVVNALRDHQGPSLVTARLELVTAMDEGGNPTKEKWWKAGGEKNLPYEVGFIVEMRASYPEHVDLLRGVKSARYKHPTNKAGKPAPVPLADDWSIEGLWTQLGLAEASAPRQHAHTVVQDDDKVRIGLLTEIGAAAGRAGVELQEISNDWAHTHDGEQIRETTDLGGLEMLRDDLLMQAARAEEAAAKSPDTAADNDSVTSGPEVANSERSVSRSDEDVARVTAALDSAETLDQLKDVWRLGSRLGVLDAMTPTGESVGSMIMARRDQAAVG